MDIQEFINSKGEALKKMGAIFWLLNKIETEIISHITIFFTDWSDAGNWKTIILNRALFNVKIFETLESKRFFFETIIKDLDHVAKWKGVTFDPQRWSKICKDISKIQKIRNQLAHNFLNFSADGKTAHFVSLKTLTGKYERKEIDLDAFLSKADAVSKELMDLLPQFLEKAQGVIKTPDPKFTVEKRK